ncbi:formylglycine-generating enzyme family protein [Candidatus Fermentibacteria bacterium]|nr:formylglycine-generating enzyme family protein [Candidatus Fermentibacteria bacterium]
MSTYEVTQAEYQDVMGTNPSHFPGAERPVERVTWWNAALFCNALSVREGLTAFYNDGDLTAQGDTVRMDWSADGYRLPTEAEWEYACRAGTTTDFYSGSQSSSRHDQNMDLIGWYWFNSEWSPQDVGQKLPNAFGVYDMSGNVAEWCNDRFGAYSAESQTDPHGPTFGASRLTRGGSWYNYPQVCRSANRDQYHPSQAYYTVGFRLARRQ